MTSHQNTRILIVDDDIDLANLLVRFLSPSYRTILTHSGEEALALLSEHSFNLVLLDVKLPDMNGIDVLEILKEKYPYLPVMLFTGYANIDDAVLAMRQGAFDYLEKPFSRAKILDRVEQSLAHAKEERQHQAKLKKLQKLLTAGLNELGDITTDMPIDVPQPPVNDATLDPDRYLQRGTLKIDLYRREATLNNTELDLTAGEYDLLLCLVQKSPRVLSPEEIVQKTRGYECSLREARELVRWQIYLLRQKVEDDPAAPKYVLNVRGRGYMWAS